MADQKKVIKVGSRKSQLALIQTNSVIDQLKAIYPALEFEIISMTTTGDKILDTALSKIGEKNLFTKELEHALLEHSVDFLVHSLKDLPTVLPDKLVIGAICKRDNPHDALVLHPKHTDTSLDSLPPQSIIGTSSLRRGAQLKRKYPQFQIKDVRGNLNTRLRKLDEADDYDALVLAVAGLERMGWKNRISQVLDPEVCMYAVSQGAMAVECRADDGDTLGLLRKLNDKQTLLQCVAERAFLRKLEGGCSVPVAVNTEVNDKEISLRGGVYSIDGADGVMDALTKTFTDDEAPPEKMNNGPKMYAAIVAEEFSQSALQTAEDLGIELADKMMAAGAAAILAVAKEQTAVEILKQKAEKEAKMAAADGVKS